MSGSGPHFRANSLLLQEFIGPLLAEPAVVLILFGSALCWPILTAHKHIYFGSFMLSGFMSAMILASGLLLLPLAIRFDRIVRYFFPKSCFVLGTEQLDMPA
jgi:hypothetical protein